MPDERVALVTGSSSGIGAAVATRMAVSGIRVMVNSARSVEAGQTLADTLPGAAYTRADISVESEARDLVAATVERFGRLDVLVNNAGTTRFIPHHDLDAVTGQVWRDILDTNVIGTWQVTAAAVPHLRDTGDGCVINVASLAGLRPNGSSIPYAASKAAVIHLTRLLANVLGPQIRVNAVAPGLVETPWIAPYQGTREYVTETAPLRRVATPEDIADVVCDLADFRYVTGEVIVADGGLHLH
ncbi:MAG TPA: SDR family oxidoreductase [Mycobacteriales bacterium]|nr:SDR family oxidoreductase [Mycobacteriales bacterium]